MDGPKECEPNKLATAMQDLHVAEAEMDDATRALAKAEAEVGAAVAHLRVAEEEIRQAEETRPAEVTVKVDGRPHQVRAGTYLVSAFKTLVGVAAARELDIVKHEAFAPLNDASEIHICGHEVFISHVRTGGSS
jgi:hypothetical protein